MRPASRGAAQEIGIRRATVERVEHARRDERPQRWIEVHRTSQPWRRAARRPVCIPYDDGNVRISLIILPPLVDARRIRRGRVSRFQPLIYQAVSYTHLRAH